VAGMEEVPSVARCRHESILVSPAVSVTRSLDYLSASG
jgi:hypothetical protein